MYSEDRRRGAGQRSFEGRYFLRLHVDWAGGKPVHRIVVGKGIPGRRDLLGSVDEPLSENRRKAAPNMNSRISRAPVVIIGGGVAGLTAANLLARNGFDVAIFEAS